MSAAPAKSGSYIEAGITLTKSRNGAGRSRAVLSALRRQWRSSSNTRSVAFGRLEQVDRACAAASRAGRATAPRGRACRPRWMSTIGWNTEVIWSPRITSCRRQRVWKSACILLDPDALPGLVHDPRHHALGHDQRVVEHDGVADRDLAPAPQVGRAQVAELAVELLAHALADRLHVADARSALLLAALGRQEQQERVAAAVVEREQVRRSHFLALQLSDEAADHRQHLVERLRAVVVLDLRQLGRVDQDQPEVTLVPQLLDQVAQPLVVGRDV